MTDKRPTAWIIGESPLTEEMATLCTEEGIGKTLLPASSTRTKKRTSVKTGSSRKTHREDAAFELTNTDLVSKKSNLLILERRLGPSIPIFSSCVTVTAGEQASWLKYPDRLIGMAVLPTLLSGKLWELAPTVHTSHSTIEAATAFLSRLGKKAIIVQDRVGMVFPRILCMIVNEAAFAVTENVASSEAIDAAMKLGTNYPFGPIEWGNRIGLKQVISTLDALYRDLGEDRYRAAPLLRQLAIGKPWWGT